MLIKTLALKFSTVQLNYPMDLTSNFIQLNTKICPSTVISKRSLKSDLILTPRGIISLSKGREFEPYHSTYTYYYVLLYRYPTLLYHYRVAGLLFYFVLISTLVPWGKLYD